jgi:hypothetical protein
MANRPTTYSNKTQIANSENTTNHATACCPKGTIIKAANNGPIAVPVLPPT